MPLEDFCRLRGVQFDADQRQKIDHDVRRAAYSIIEGKGATYYGIGSALARIIDVILNDQRAILTVCTPITETCGGQRDCLASPSGRGGRCAGYFPAGSSL